MNIIDVKNLTKKFGELTAVDDITFSVKEGEIFAFLGPNGAGKSTSIKMLTTLLDLTHGTVRLNNFDVVATPTKHANLSALFFRTLHRHRADCLRKYGIPRRAL